jgi:Kef-type K+ transport system membrane component KefB
MPFLFLFAIVAVVVSLGFSAVIGAYIAGLAVAESVLAERTQRRTGFLLVLFGALFFVITGSQFDFHRFAELEVVGVGLAVTGIATVGKVVGVYPFARWSTGSDRAARTISLGMIPRGEIALVVGAAGFAAGILNEAEFGVILLLSIATTVIGSVLFRALAPAPGDGRTDRPAGGAGPSAASPGTVGPSQT